MRIRESRQPAREKISRNIRGSSPGALDFLWLEITAQCNLSCIHCYADASPARRLHGNLGFADWRDALRQAAELGCRRVQFIGGEPTLHPSLAKLIECARADGFTTVEVFTNGTVFTETLKESFLRHRTRLAFSVYSARAEIHDAVTQEKGSFSRTMTSIQWAVRSGLPVRVAAVQMKANAGDLGQTRNMLEGMGVSSISSGPVREVGRGLRRKKVGSRFDALCGRCWQKKLCLTPSGEIFPCVFSRFYPVGILAQGLEKVLNSPTLSAFREKLLSGRVQQPDNAQTKGCVCEPDLEPVPCDPDLEPLPCEPDLEPLPCDPDLEPLPCDPDLEPLPCEPDLEPVPCNPDLEPVPCDPDLEPVPCDPDL